MHAKSEKKYCVTQPLPRLKRIKMSFEKCYIDSPELYPEADGYVKLYFTLILGVSHKRKAEIY